MLRRTIVILLFIPQLIYSQTSDLPFQVLVAKNASVYGNAVEPLRYVDDVTSIEVGPDGFLSLVHKGGTTYEFKEKVFTFYLKPEKLKEQAERPELKILYEDSSRVDENETIAVLHPKFDANGVVKWEAMTPFEFFWYLPNEVAHTFKISVADHTGKKIQDFGTSKNKFVIKPFNFGLDEDSFIFQISRTFVGETISSMEYHIKLEEAPKYPTKASDLVLKTLNLELSPTYALEVWKEILAMENGQYYMKLFEKFIGRNKKSLANSSEDIEQLLSQNK